MNEFKDIIGDKHLYGGINRFFSNDRFGQINSALRINIGYINFPSDVYFKADFTVTGWIQIYQNRAYAPFFDFGNGVAFHLSEGTGYNMYFEIFYQTTKTSCGTKVSFTLNKWDFVAITLQQTIVSIYLNGILVCLNLNIKIPRNIIRTKNFLGYSNWGSGFYANADFDEIKIFNKSLNSSEIIQEYNIQNLIIKL